LVNHVEMLMLVCIWCCAGGGRVLGMECQVRGRGSINSSK